MTLSLSVQHIYNDRKISNMMNHILGDLLNTEHEKRDKDEGIEGNANAATGDDDKNSNGNKSGNKGKNTLKRVNSTPIWPTELPDVFLFPDTFFQLQKDLNYCVLEYLIRMGYAGAADTFSKELQCEDKDVGHIIGQSQVLQEANNGKGKDENLDITEESLDVQKEKMSQLFSRENLINNDDSAENSEIFIKQQQSTIGMGSVYERKAIMIMLMNGQAKETIEFISRKWPFFFDDFPIIKLRLLHLQAIEIIRDFFSSDISGLTTEELEEKEERFFNEFMEFIKVNLSDDRILKSSRFIKDMELTMGLLSYGKFKSNGSESSYTETLPPELKKIVDFSLRETIAVRVNKALLTYVDGVTFNGELIEGLQLSEGTKEGCANLDSTLDDVAEEDESENGAPRGYGVGDDDPNDPLLCATEGEVRVLQRFNNGDSKLLQLVKLFVWSYKLNSQSNSSLSSRQRLEKMAEITLGQ